LYLLAAPIDDSREPQTKTTCTIPFKIAIVIAEYGGQVYLTWNNEIVLIYGIKRQALSLGELNNSMGLPLQLHCHGTVAVCG
jgi:hypothetical protein